MTREEAIYRLNNTAWLGSDADRVATENAVQMAIEALKAQATLDDVSTAYENGYTQGRFEALQWIPCSERLPNDGYNVLMCRKNGTVGEGCYHSIIGEWSQFRWNASGVKDVIAWMPLPEPYKEDES